MSSPVRARRRNDSQRDDGNRGSSRFLVQPQRSVALPTAAAAAGILGQNQVSLQSFYASTDPYFRPVTDEDIKWLSHHAPDVELFVVPELGRHYLKVWAELDGEPPPPAEPLQEPQIGGDVEYEAMAVEQKILQALGVGHSSPTSTAHVADPGGVADITKDVKREFPDDLEPPEVTVIFPHPSDTGRCRTVARLEQRIVEELRYIGVLSKQEADRFVRSQDEVSLTLRQMQRDLLQQTRLNARRRNRLIGIAQRHLNRQAQQSAVKDFDKEVEIAFARRHLPDLAPPAPKKRKQTSSGSRYSNNADDASTLKSTISRRHRLARKLNTEFPPVQFQIPAKTIYGIVPPP